MYKIAKFVSAMAAVGMAGSVMAATPISITQNTTAAQFNTTQSQFRNGTGTSTFIGTTSTTSPVLIPMNSFDTNTGILVGARFSVNIPYTVSISAIGTVPASGNGRRVDVTSTVSGAVSIAGASVSSATLAGAPKCIAGDCGNLSTNNTDSASGTIVGNAVVAAANLAALVGTGPGTVNFTSRVDATNTSVTNSANVTTGTAFSQFMLGGTTASANQYSLTYDYLNFATPSFNGSTVQTTQTLDFGTVSNRGGPVLLNFSLFNIGNINSADVELFQIDGPGNTQFSTTTSPFLNLAAGASNNYSVSFNPLNLGAANGVYTFLMRDRAPGGVGIRQYELTLNVMGQVFDPVPEPASWMMMMLGFGLVGAVVRRRAAGQPG